MNSSDNNHPLRNSEILFHNVDLPLYHTKKTPEEKFGILRIKMDPKPNASILRKIAIIFTIDCSASMTDYCNDNRRKLDHAVQTLIGIMRYLADDTKRCSDTEVVVAVLSFSTRIKRIIDFTHIHKDNLAKIIDSISDIYAQDSTNIEIAIKEADKMLLEYSENNPDTMLYHIQLTDGEVTDGERDHTKLAEMVNSNYTNIFVGFGKYHDDHLLCKLSKNPKNDYRFIDKLEFSSIVYGEILYNILYHKYDTVNIELQGAEIYDWRTNQWGSSLQITNLPYDCERIFQLRADATIDINTIEGVLRTFPNLSNESEKQEIYCYPELVDIESGNREIRDLTKYSFRQRTQELLYEVREFIQENMKQSKDMDLDQDSQNANNLNPLSVNTSTSESNTTENIKKNLYEKCRDFMRTMKEYSEANSLTEDRSLRLLQDDIYIILKTLYRRNAHMWCTTRQISLGREHSYQPTQGFDLYDGSLLDTDINMDATLLSPPKLRRNRPKVYYTTRDPPIYTFALFEHPLNTPDIVGEDSYELSQNYDMAMMSPSLARTVCAMSGESNNTTVL